ncbi:MAG: polysaccharide deacetylase family protein [Acidaminococcaceae bacterium]|nr:polysaccharide deacetylase family protein [Acidaminococcaceae bacterium]
MRVLCIMGACYLAALVFLWAGRRGTLSRKLAALVSVVCLLAGSGALAAAVYPVGNSYGKTVNRLQDLPGGGKTGSGNTKPAAPIPGGAAEKPAPGSDKTSSSATTSGGYMALTFDDGPYPPYTDRLLDVLKEKKAHATFFLVAEQAQKHPELVRRMAEEGHTVGLHAFRHRDFLKLAEADKENDLEQGKNVLQVITGKEPVYWRPPHGFRDFSVTEAAGKQKLTVVNWSVIPRDWTGIGKQEIHDRVMDKAENGSIVLLHDGDSPFYKASRQATVDAAALLIDSLREKGYHLVSVEEYVSGK